MSSRQRAKNQSRTHVQATVQTPRGPQVRSIDLAHVELPRFEQAQIRSSRELWVEYGSNNLFPDFLIECVQKSSRHSAYLNLRENAIKGGKVGPTYSADVKDFMENIDGVGGTLRKLIDSWAVDLAILETFAAFVRYNKKGEIAAIDYLDSSKVRVAKVVASPEDLATGVAPDLHGYYVSDDWSDTQRNKPVYYEKFNPFPRNAKGDIVVPTASTQLFYYRKRTLKQPYYPHVSYISCLNYVLAQEQLSLYGLNRLLNGMLAASIIHMVAPGMDDEEQSLLKRRFQDKYSGAENSGKSILVTAENENQTLKVIPLTEGDNTELIESIRTQAESAIDVAHRCRPELVGVPTSGGLASDGSSIGPSMEVFQNNVINALQAAILDFVNDVLRFNGYSGYELDIAENVLVKELSPQWFEEANIKRESLARKYGWKDSDLTTLSAPVPTAAPTPDEVTPEAKAAPVDAAPGAVPAA